jgi:hypothetical protein
MKRPICLASTASALLATALLVTSSNAQGSSSQSPSRRSQYARLADPISFWKKRQTSGDAADQATLSTMAETNPFGASSLADQQPFIKGNYTGNDYNAASLTPQTGDFQQLPWNVNVYFQQSAATNGSELGGWQEIPETPGFILNRTVAISNKSGSGIMPFYITENTLTPQLVKRAIMMWPGKVSHTSTKVLVMLTIDFVAERRLELCESNAECTLSRGN